MMSKPSALICLDSGTTSVKAAAFGRDGRILAVAQRDNTALRRKGAYVEQDMDVTRDDAFAVLRQCVQQADAVVEGVLITGQGDGLWPLGCDNRPAGLAMTWLDGRARRLLAEFQASGALNEIHAICGSLPTAASQSLQLLWLQQYEPERFARIAKILRLKEWLFLSLTGTLLGEPSAALPVWGDYRTGQTSTVIQSVLGLERGIGLLPDFEEVGACRAGLSAQAAAATGIAAGTPVLQGPGDVQSTLIGLGLGTRPGVTRASIFGTSAIHACHLHDPAVISEHPAGAMMQRFVLGPGYLCFHPSFNGATLLHHLNTLLARQPDVVKPRYSGLVVQPFFEPGGERAPLTTPHATGAILGLTAQTTSEQIAWAGREALAFIARMSHDMMNAPAGIVALGGGLAGDVHFSNWLATVLQSPVERATGGQAGLCGLGAIGARYLLDMSDATLSRDWIVAAQETARPDPAVTTYAEEKYALFKRLLEAVSSQWETMSAVRDMANSLMEADPA